MAFDFPNSPTIGQVYNGYVWDGEKWQVQGAATFGAVRYDTAQGLTSAQKSQARSNIDVLKKNYIINGAMMISQENGSTSGGVSGYYPVDQFFSNITGSSGTIATAQVTNSPSPAGSPNRLRYVAATADAAVAAGDLAWVTTRVEGLRAADLRFGSAAAKTVTLQFGVRAPAGTYCVTFRNGGGLPTRSYVAEYVISAGEANTDVVRSVTLTGDIAGTWLADNTVGIEVSWTLMCGTTYQTPAGVWTAGNLLGTANQFNFMGTANNFFELFDVSLTEGTVAPSFQVPDYASELALCRRYYERVGMTFIATSSPYHNTAWFKASKRTMPTVTIVNGNGNSGTVGVPAYSPLDGLRQLASATAPSDVEIAVNARL